MCIFGCDEKIKSLEREISNLNKNIQSVCKHEVVRQISSIKFGCRDLYSCIYCKKEISGELLTKGTKISRTKVVFETYK